MLSSVIKEYVPQFHDGFTKENTVVVSIMPCSAKKAEIKRPQLTIDGKYDTDYVLTTVEFAQMIKSAGLDLNRQTITGEHDLLFKKLIEMNEGKSCKRQVLFHIFWQLIFHKKRQLIFHTYLVFDTHGVIRGLFVN